MTHKPIIEEYVNEEASSQFGYLSGYERPRPVAEQMAILKVAFKKIGSFDASVATRDVLPGAEGYFLWPDWRKLAPTYGKAVELVLAKLSRQRKGLFYNYCNGVLGPNFLRESAKKTKMFKKLGDEQKGHDVLVCAAQFGIHHCSRSVECARAVMDASECSLGAFEVGVMLLIHPIRLANFDDLRIYAGGDEYSPMADGVFSRSPCFRFHDPHLEFSTSGLDSQCSDYGSASAFASTVPSE